MSRRTSKSFCRICQAFCAIEVEFEDGRVVTVRGDRRDPATGGYTCVKGRQLPEQLGHPGRLRSSLCRGGDGRFQPIASAGAMDEIARRLERIVAEHGPRSVASYCGTAAFFNSGTVPVVKAWHRGLGSPSFYTSLSIDQSAKIMAVARHGLWAGGTHSFRSADVALVVGNNPIVSHLAPPSGVPMTSPAKQLADARRRGLKLICVDPRRSELARRADLHLQLRPGEDPTLLAGMLRVILEEERHDAAFCAEHVEGLDSFREAIRDFRPDYVQARTRVPAEQMIAAARLFATGPRDCATSGTGPDMAPHPNLSEHLVTCFNTLCGRQNREGERIDNAGVLSQALPRSAQVIPPELLPPELRRGGGPGSRIGGFERLGDELPTSMLADEILEPGEGQVRAMFVVGGNPVLAWPDQRKTLRALEALDLLVCIDVELSATARCADYAIATRLPLERDDVTLFPDFFYEIPYSHYAPALVEPDFDAIEDWELFLGLARRMKTPMELPAGALDPERPPGKFELLERITAGSRVPLARTREREGGRVFDEIEVRVGPPIPGIEGRLRLLPAGVAEELRAVRAEPVPQPGRYGEDGSFTHLLICRRLRQVMNSLGRDLPQSRKQGATNPASMNGADLDELGLRPGDLVEVESEHDAILAVAEASDELERGVVSMAHCWGDTPGRDDEVRSIGANTARLVSTERHVDPLSGMPRQSAIPVRVRAARGAESSPECENHPRASGSSFPEPE
jgi:anaerobic selenocysteine-containing dehydrogenase